MLLLPSARNVDARLVPLLPARPALPTTLPDAVDARKAPRRCMCLISENPPSEAATTAAAGAASKSSRRATRCARCVCVLVSLQIGNVGARGECARMAWKSGCGGPLAPVREGGRAVASCGGAGGVARPEGRQGCTVHSAHIHHARSTVHAGLSSLRDKYSALVDGHVLYAPGKECCVII